MKKIILLSVSILLISLGFAFAEVPCKINYQGRLIENNVPVDGTKKMKFSIYNETNNLLWTSKEVDITVYNGLFRYVLDLSSIDDWTAGQELYLEVQVGTDILTPREAIYAYPYAINSHLLEGKTTDYFLNTTGETQKKDGGLNIMGNVGIGTTGPGQMLELYKDNADSVMRFHDPGDAWFSMGIDRDTLKFHINQGSGVGTSTGLIIDQSNNVGIGTTDPGEKLTVTGTIESTTGGVKFPDGTLQTTAPSAPTIEVINANANKTYTRNHTGLVLIEAHYCGYYVWGYDTIKIEFLVDGEVRKSFSQTVNYHNWPSPTFAYSAIMSGNYTFRVNTWASAGSIKTKSLQFVITEY